MCIRTIHYIGICGFSIMQIGVAFWMGMSMNRSHIGAALSFFLMFSGPLSASARDYFGLVDTTGRFVLPCDYAGIRVVDGSKYVVKPYPKTPQDPALPFVVDVSGKISNETAPPEEPYKPLPPPGCLPLDEYQEVSTASSDGPLWGIKNIKTGLMAIPFQHSDQPQAFPLGDGMFVQEEYPVDMSDHLKVRTKLIKEGGHFVAYVPHDLRVLQFRRFSSGFVLAEDPGTGKAGFIGKNGKLLGDRIYDNAEPFSEGFAAVRFIDGSTTFSGMIDTAGKFVYGPFKDIGIEPFYDGLARTYRKAKQGNTEKLFYGLINRDFRTVLKPNYPLIRIGGRNILARSDRSDEFRWNLFDVSGHLVFQFPKEVTLVDEYSGDNNSFAVAVDKMPLDKLPLFGASDNAKYGYVDRTGTFFIEPRFDSAAPFRDGVAVVTVKEENASGKIERAFGLIDKSGKYIIKPVYSQLLSYRPLLVAMDKRGPSFDSYKWKHPDQPFSNRREHWNDFLASYDVIGMARKDIYELLGEPDEVPKPDRGRGITIQPDETALKHATDKALRLPIVTYNICGGICGYSAMMVQFEFADDKVIGWRTGNYSEKPGPWIKEDMRKTPPDSVPKQGCHFAPALNDQVYKVKKENHPLFSETGAPIPNTQ